MDRIIETLSGEIEGQSLEWLIKETDKLLAKLDGVPKGFTKEEWEIVEKETEKKEVLIPLIAKIISKETTEEYCSSERIAELIYDTLKASGGEKDSDKGERKTIGQSLKDDSKPPEPNRYVTVEHDGNAKSEAKLRLEPREDDSIPWEKDMIIYHGEAYNPKFFKIVNWEDLELLIKSFMNEKAWNDLVHNNWKKIKEADGIE